jgi:hypothetical protein
VTDNDLVVEIALAIQEEELAWRLSNFGGQWEAIRCPVRRVLDFDPRANPKLVTSTFERFPLGIDESEARSRFKNQIALACAKAVLLIVGKHAANKRSSHETETMSASPEQRGDDGVD